MKIRLIFLSMVLLPFIGISQLSGIWEVTEVKVGEEIMTPQSKWFEFRSDQSLYGGNGGVINTRGSYKVEENKVSIFNKDGQDDGYGSFTITESSASEMTWSREEEGMVVLLSLKSVETIPVAPWDIIVGQWEMDHSEDGYLFRWDKFFIHIVDGKKNWGVWHMHAHKPELRLMYFEEGKKDDLWIYKMDGEKIKILNDQKVVFTLTRSN